jgi:hypothetical protein
MTSQLNVDTIVDKAGSGGSNVKMANTSTYVDGSVTQNTVQGLAKHWSQTDNFGNIDESFNLASLTDVTTGQSRLTITNNFSGTNNCSSVSQNYFGIDTEFDNAISQSSGGIQTTSTISISSKYTSTNGYLDTNATGCIFSMVHGDLA